MNLCIRKVAGKAVEAFYGDTNVEEPGPGWHRTSETACIEWMRDDNRVCINNRSGTWQAYARAERSYLWDLIEAGEVVDDGKRHYPPVGTPQRDLWGVVLEVGALFAPLSIPLPDLEVQAS